MRIGRIIAYMLLGTLLALLESTLIPFLPSPWGSFHPILPIIVLLVVMDDPVPAAIVAGMAGAVVDVFAPDGAKFAFGVFLAIVLAVRFMSQVVLTNQSQYTAISLALFARFLERSWVCIIQLIRRGNAGWDVITWHAVWKIGVWDIVCIGMLFFIVVFLRKRFVPTGSNMRTSMRR